MTAVATIDSRRDAILSATDRLLARYGYRKMTIDDIAQEAGIGKGSVYLDFRSKEAVVLSLIDRVVSQVLAKLTSIAHKGDESPESRLRKMLITRVTERCAVLGHYSSSLYDLLAALRPALHAQRGVHLKAEAQIFVGVIEEGVHHDLFVAPNARRTADALLTATNSLLPYYLSPEQLGSPGEIERRASDIVDLLIHGLNCAPRTEARG